ncbi:MAG: Lar family restriction alleviation protein [Reinekea sp.]|nr:Lar family restriction alleviation protein [Reinekea sp.]
MSDELKPCPFCGGEAGFEYDSGMVYIECDDCFATTGLFMSQDIAAKKWNTRAQPTIADYLKANEAMLTKTKAKMVSIDSLKQFAGIKGYNND